MVADSDSLRTRRHRRHKRGDHSLCRHGEDGARPALAPVPVAAGGGDLDPRAALEQLARRLEAAHEANPADAAVARVLKDVLLAMPAGEADAGTDDDPLAELRALAEAVP